MAYDSTKLTRLAHLKQAAEALATRCATKAELAAMSDRIDAIVSSGGEPNVLNGVKVNGTALTIAGKMVDILIAAGSSNGTISVNNVDVAVTGLAALAYKAQISELDLDAALKDVINGKASGSDVSALMRAVNTLNGTGEGSVQKTVDDAIDSFASEVSNDGIVNTIKELVDWVSAHGAEASEMAAGIQTNAGNIAALEDLVGKLPADAESTTIVEYVAEAIAAIGIGNYAKTSDVTEAIANALALVYTKEETESKLSQKVARSGDTMEGNLDMDGHDLPHVGHMDVRNLVIVPDNDPTGDVGVSAYVEDPIPGTDGRPGGQRLSFYGLANDEAVVLHNVHDPLTDTDAVPLRYMEQYVTDEMDGMIATDAEVSAMLDDVFGTE